MTRREPAGLRSRDALVALVAVAGLLQAIISFLGYADVRAAVATIGVLGLVGCWVLRQRTGRRWAVVPLGLFAVVVAIAGDTPLGMASVCLAVLLLVLDLGAAVGGVYLLTFTAALAVAGVGFSEREVPYLVVQTSITVMLLGMTWVVAVLVGRSDQERQARETLLEELERTNRQLSAANDRLQRSIATEKELVLADERARTAREMHDGLGHQLTCIRMSLDFAERSWPEPDALTEVRSARELSEEALREMRLWVRALNPPRVANLTGTAAFDDIAEAFRGTGVQVSVQVTGPEQPLSPETALFCYRLLQEGLTNALRHARATEVRVCVGYPTESSALSVRVRDNGSVPVENLREGFGLRSLRERAHALGGRVDAGWAGDGFELAAEVPL